MRLTSFVLATFSALSLLACTTKIVIVAPSAVPGTAAPASTEALAPIVAPSSTPILPLLPSPDSTEAPVVITPLPEVPTVLPAAAKPTIPAGPATDAEAAGQAAQAYFLRRVNNDPYHPPGVVSCDPPEFHPVDVATLTITAVWSVFCRFTADVGYYPGFGPNDPAVKQGLVSPHPYPTGVYFKDLVFVDDHTGEVRDGP